MLGTLVFKTFLELKRARLVRIAHHPKVAARLHPPGTTEPEVEACLTKTDWKGPVWDVGASIGNMAYQLAQRNDVVAFEPNLNTLYYLGYKLKFCPRVVLVPCALTLDGKPMRCSIDPDFTRPNAGPMAATLSVAEALQKFGRPALIKMDIEGGEYELIKSPELTGITLLVEWHRELPTSFERWDIKKLDATHTLLTPK